MKLAFVLFRFSFEAQGSPCRAPCGRRPPCVVLGRELRFWGLPPCSVWGLTLDSSKWSDISCTGSRMGLKGMKRSARWGLCHSFATDQFVNSFSQVRVMPFSRSMMGMWDICRWQQLLYSSLVRESPCDPMYSSEFRITLVKILFACYCSCFDTDSTLQDLAAGCLYRNSRPCILAKSFALTARGFTQRIQPQNPQAQRLFFLIIYSRSFFALLISFYLDICWLSRRRSLSYCSLRCLLNYFLASRSCSTQPPTLTNGLSFYLLSLNKTLPLQTTGLLTNLFLTELLAEFLVACLLCSFLLVPSETGRGIESKVALPRPSFGTTSGSASLLSAGALPELITYGEKASLTSLKLSSVEQSGTF